MDTLNLVFIGMIAFAGDLDEGPLWSLMVDVRQPSDSEPACDTPAVYGDELAHEAFVLVPPNAIIACTSEEDQAAWEDFYPGGTPQACPKKRFFLTGHDLELSAEVLGDEVFRLQGRRGSPGAWSRNPMNHSEAKAFGWIADVSTFAASRANVRRSCFFDEISDCPVVGRMALPAGVIWTSHIKERKDPQCEVGDDTLLTGYATFQVVEPDEPIDSVGSSLAEEITLTVDTKPGEPRILILRRFDDPGRYCRVAMPTGDQSVWLMNAKKGLEYSCDMTDYGDPHYELFQEFYKLTASSSTPGACPHPKEACAPWGSPRCPLALMSVD